MRKTSGRFRSGFGVAAGIVGLGALLGLLAVAGRPQLIRRPDSVARPVLLVPDFQNRTGDPDLFGFADRLTEAVRERMDGDPAAIFTLSPRRLRPVLTAAEREVGLLRIAGRLGADYVLAGTLETGPDRRSPRVLRGVRRPVRTPRGRPVGPVPPASASMSCSCGIRNRPMSSPNASRWAPGTRRNPNGSASRAGSRTASRSRSAGRSASPRDPSHPRRPRHLPGSSDTICHGCAR